MVERHHFRTPSRFVLAALVAISISPMGGAASNPGDPPSEQGPPTAEQDGRININEAGAEVLVALPGIGPARAEAIIAEREKRRFRRVEDIMRVPGIGRKTFVRIRDSIRVR
jgi:competence protein ComEA